MNTLKFGNGEWYGKKDTILAYNDENSNFKPLPFSFDRDTLATRVNKDGLIETVGSGEPRIDYKDDSNGALLLEPSRSNLIEYSNLKSGWSLLSGGSIAYDQTISPDGTQNASVLSGDGVNGNSIYDFVILSTQTYIFSVFAKQKDASIISLKGFSGGAAGTSKFNLSNGTIDTVSAGQFSDEKIEDYGNGWYRCSVKITATSSGSKTLGFGGENSDSGELFSLYGAQLEQGSYATSYIPTQGSAVTRVDDVCNNGANEQVINSTEGVLYFEGSALANDGTDRKITLSDNSLNNAINFGYSRFSGNINAEVISGGVLQTSGFGATGVTQDNNNKFALSWGNGISKFYVNGTLASSHTNVTSPIGMNVLNFSLSSGFQKMFSNTKDLRVYNTALTDQELINLTTI